MPPDRRILKCLACKSMQITAVSCEVTWKCKYCDYTQLMGKVYFRGRLGMCHFYLEYVVHKKTHTCEIIYDGEHPSTSEGLVKKILFKPVAGNETNPEPTDIDQGNGDKENKRKNVEVEENEGGDFIEYLSHRIKAHYRLYAQNQNLNP